MNWLIAYMHTANYMTDFKKGVAHVVRQLISRHIDYSVSQKVFRNSLHKHWQARDVGKLRMYPKKRQQSEGETINKPSLGETNHTPNSPNQGWNRLPADGWRELEEMDSDGGTSYNAQMDTCRT